MGKTKLIELTLIVLFTFSGFSGHTRRMPDGKAYNGNNQPIGVEYEEKGHTFGILRFINSFHRESISITYSQSWFRLAVVKGYEGHDPLFAGYFCQKFDWERLQVEVGVLPDIISKEPTHVGIVLFKYKY